jgi:hypothetical protein
MTMQNPTASSDGGASTPVDPIDRIEAFLAAEDGDSGTGNDDTSDDPKQPAATPDKPDDGEQGKDSEPQFTTTHLAQYLGLDEAAIDVDEDGQPVFKSKIDGKESPVKFQDLLKSYQLQGHAENRTREAAEREKAAERKLQEADQAIQAKYQEQQETVKTLGQFAAVLQHELNGEIQQQPWDQLWEQNPAQARKLERYYSDRQARVNGILQQLAQRDAQAKQQAEQARKDNEEKAKEAQIRRLFELIPDWKDQNVAEKERMELLSWVAKSGFDASDLDLNKASQVALLRRAWQHDTLQKSKPAIEAKVRAAPKLIKPGQAPQQEGNESQLRSLKQHARTTGGDSTKAVAAWLQAKGLA